MWYPPERLPAWQPYDRLGLAVGGDLRHEFHEVTGDAGWWDFGIVLDAADVNEVSAFWAGFLDGRVLGDDERFHCVIDSRGEWVLGVQHAPDHTPPRWPAENPQQVHVDFHVSEPAELHERAVALGAKLLQDGDMSATHGHRVCADPAGHPFCIGWGHPDADALRRFLEQNPD